VKRGLRKPARLLPGHTIGLVSPSGPAFAKDGTTPDRLEAARAHLSEAGFRTVVGAHALGVRGYLAGSDADRVSDLHAMFADPGIDAVLCIRGGYGAMRLLDALDYDVIRRHPKVFIGFSDITVLHLAFSRRAELVTFHGPNAPALSKHDGYDLGELLRAVTRPDPLGPLANPPDGSAIETLVPGIAEGRLIGGNASALTGLLGTSYLPSLGGAVLVLEEFADATFRLDRNLMQLRMAGVLERVSGIVVGECRVQTEPKDPGLTVREVLEDLIVPLGKPAIYGLACGHGGHHLTLPLGVLARLDATHGVLSIEESAVT
jgi:muramoyltetrapeptide carboxypeptidase